MHQHHDQVETDVPELGGMVLASLQKIIQLDSFVASLGGSPLVVHQLPFVTFSRGIGIETDVGLHGNGTGSAEFGGGARGFAGANAIVVQRATELGILSAEIIAIGFHLQTCRTDRNAVGANGHAMIIRSFLGVAEIQINERRNGFLYTKLVHGHRVMCRVQQE